MIRTAGLVRAVFLVGVLAGCGAMEPAPGLQAAAYVAPQVTPVATRVQPAATRPPPTATPLPMPIAGKVVVAVVQVDSLRTRAYPGTEYAILFANRRGDVLYVAGDAGGAENAWLPIYVMGKGYGWVAQRYVELQERPATGVDYAVWLERIYQIPVDLVQVPDGAPAPTQRVLVATAVPAPDVQIPDPTVAVPAGETISRSYKWFYKGEWTWELEIPLWLYDKYKQLPRARTRNYSIYVTHPEDDYYIDQLADLISEGAVTAGYTAYETVELAAAFVQGLPYTVDSVTSAYDEYPRYPVETLVDYGGDCEDTSILLAAIVDKLGYGVALIMPPGHLAVGIKGSDDLPGSYWKHQGTKYYYVETTGEGFGIGEVPDVYTTANADVFPIASIAVLAHDWVATRSGNQLTVRISVANVGTAKTSAAVVSAGFESGDLLYSRKDSGVFSVVAGAETSVDLVLKVPAAGRIRLRVWVSDEGAVVDESTGDWFDSE